MNRDKADRIITALADLGIDAETGPEVAPTPYIVPKAALTEEEKQALRLLDELEKVWPNTLWIRPGHGRLIVMRRHDGREPGQDEGSPNGGWIYPAEVFGIKTETRDEKT